MLLSYILTKIPLLEEAKSNIFGKLIVFQMCGTQLPEFPAMDEVNLYTSGKHPSWRGLQ